MNRRHTDLTSLCFTPAHSGPMGKEDIRITSGYETEIDEDDFEIELRVRSLIPQDPQDPQEVEDTAILEGSGWCLWGDEWSAVKADRRLQYTHSRRHVNRPKIYHGVWDQTARGRAQRAMLYELAHLDWTEENGEEEEMEEVEEVEEMEEMEEEEGKENNDSDDSYFWETYRARIAAMPQAPRRIGTQKTTASLLWPPPEPSVESHPIVKSREFSSKHLLVQHGRQHNNYFLPLALRADGLPNPPACHNQVAKRFREQCPSCRLVSIETALNSKVAFRYRNRFLSLLNQDNDGLRSVLSFHGTPQSNVLGIRSLGLLVHNSGIWSSQNANIATFYARGEGVRCMFACITLVRDPTQSTRQTPLYTHDNYVPPCQEIIVQRREDMICPFLLLRFTECIRPMIPTTRYHKAHKRRLATRPVWRVGGRWMAPMSREEKNERRRIKLVDRFG